MSENSCLVRSKYALSVERTSVEVVGSGFDVDAPAEVADGMMYTSFEHSWRCGDEDLRRTGGAK